MKAARAGLLCAAATALLACSAPRTGPDAAPAGPVDEHVDLRSQYDALAAQGGRVFAMDPGASQIRIFAFRAGRAARFGHNHVLTAPRFAGYFHLPPGGTAQARFDLEFRLDDLEVDSPKARAGLGPAFAGEFSPEDVQSTREHMLGPDNLDAAKFPLVRIHSLAIGGEAPRFAARVQVEMHGRIREMWVPLEVEGLPERLSVSGALVLLQSDFGASPYSVMGGLLAVQDPVLIEFHLVGA